MARGLRSLTGVLSDEQVSALGLVRKPSKRQGEGGGRALLAGSSRTRTGGSATLKPGGAYLSGLSTTRTAVSMAVLSFAGGAANLAGHSRTLVRTPAAGFTPGTVTPGGDMPANTFAVGPTATGDGTGRNWSNRRAWSGITLVRGATYYLMDGSYAGRTFGALAGTARITIKKAVAADHGTDTGWNLSTMGSASAVFTSGLSITMKFLTIDGQTGSWIRPGETYGIHINEIRDTVPAFSLQDGCTDLELKHFQHNGKTSHGGGGSFANDTFSSYGAERVLVSHALTTSTGRCGLWGYTKDWIIEYYWLQKHFGTELNHSEIMSIWDTSPTERGVGNFEVRYSLFTYAVSSGGLLWDGVTNANAQFTVHGCVFYRPAGTNWEIGNGVIGSWSFPTEKMSNIRVWNNTSIEARGGGSPLAGGGLSIQATACDARNNIFYSCAAVDWVNFAVHTHNHFISTTGSAGEANATTGAGDPFVDYAGFNFRPKANTTPGFNISTFTRASAANFPAQPGAGSVGVDLYGNPRTTWTRGAIEFTP